MAVQLAHEAGGQNSELEQVWGLGPWGAQGPGVLAQLLEGCPILCCYVRPAATVVVFANTCDLQTTGELLTVLNKASTESLLANSMLPENRR